MGETPMKDKKKKSKDKSIGELQVFYHNFIMFFGESHTLGQKILNKYLIIFLF